MKGSVKKKQRNNKQSPRGVQKFCLKSEQNSKKGWFFKRKAGANPKCLKEKRIFWPKNYNTKSQEEKNSRTWKGGYRQRQNGEKSIK